MPPGIELYHKSVGLSCVGERIPYKLIQVKDKIESGHTEDIIYMRVEIDDLDAVPRFFQALLGSEEDAESSARDVHEFAEVESAGTVDGGEEGSRLIRFRGIQSPRKDDVTFLGAFNVEHLAPPDP